MMLEREAIVNPPRIKNENRNNQFNNSKFRQLIYEYKNPIHHRSGSINLNILSINLINPLGNG